jgi:hypothetical protein
VLPQCRCAPQPPQPVAEFAVDRQGPVVVVGGLLIVAEALVDQAEMAKCLGFTEPVAKLAA